MTTFRQCCAQTRGSVNGSAHPEQYPWTPTILLKLVFPLSALQVGGTLSNPACKPTGHVHTHHLCSEKGRPSLVISALQMKIPKFPEDQ